MEAKAVGIWCRTSAAAVFWEGHAFVPRSGQTAPCKAMAILAGPAGSKAGGVVTKCIGAALARLARRTCVLVHPCACMLFAFLSNLNLCGFR